MSQPNILFITTDQQRFDTIAAVANNPHVMTPHLDWLADEGISYTRCYADSPICCPSRMTMMTGRHAFTNGMTGNGAGMAEAMAGRPTLPGLLTQAGYQTRAQGKMHFSPLRCHYGFEQMELPLDYYRDMHARGKELPKQHGIGENEMYPVISTVSAQDSLTHWTVARSIDFLETRDDTRPFFMWTSFTKPHPPWDPTHEYWSLYANRDVPEPITGDWSSPHSQETQGFLDSTYCLNRADRMGKEFLRDAKRAYYACISEIDYQLGLLFARMRELNLFENTWIIFTSDHCEMLGDHGMGAKAVFHEGSAHVPLIVRPPSNSWDVDESAGKRVSKLAQIADIMPTILGIAGVDVPEGIDGADLLSLEDQEERDFFGCCGDTQFGLIRNNIKYLYAKKGGCELMFDLNKDPQETRNLINDPSSANTLKEMRELFLEKLAKHTPDSLMDGKPEVLPPIDNPDKVAKWPGFHSTVHPSDVLH